MPQLLAKPLTFGSLFAGIGGMDLGLERAGMVCKWQVEIDPFCRRVLEKHWPEVPKYGDIRGVRGAELEPVDLLAGGFPCQDLSVAGKRAGIDGARSGLWSEFARLIGELRPRYVLIENVSGLLANKPMRRVLGDLSALGLDAEWKVLSACRFGAPHTRERVFIVAYSKSPKRRAGDTSGCNLDRQNSVFQGRKEGPSWPRIRSEGERRDWPKESRPVGVANGVAHRMDRMSGCGNAVVPQVAHWVGERIVEAHNAK